MSFIIHREESRGGADHGWLKTKHSFSFGMWYKRGRLGFGALRVLNDDVIAPMSGFPMHSHEQMEIVTIVERGTLTHRDSMGNLGTVHAGEVQIMSAGTGVSHSEYNNSKEELALFQLWILPNTNTQAPRYAQAKFDHARPGETLLVAPMNSSHPLTIAQNAFISRLTLDESAPMTYKIKLPGNGVYFLVISGSVTLFNETLTARDAIGVMDEATIVLKTHEPTSLLAIEIPMQF